MAATKARAGGPRVRIDLDTDTARVLLIDDHEAISEALTPRIKKAEGLELVGTATTGERGLELADELKPDVVLVDLGLPGIDGWEVCTRLRATYPDIGIVIFTAYEGDEHVLRAQKIGVSAYVSKREKGRRVVQMLQTAAEEPHSFWAADYFDIVNRSEHAAPNALTVQELQMLDLLRQGKSMREIGEEVGQAESTTRIYLHRAYQKLDATNGVQAVANAVARGLIK
jgi:NarL family two-component system response regulator LiaR